MFKQWFHGAAIVASLFSGMSYWWIEDRRPGTPAHES